MLLPLCYPSHEDYRSEPVDVHSLSLDWCIYGAFIGVISQFNLFICINWNALHSECGPFFAKRQSLWSLWVSFFDHLTHHINGVDLKPIFYCNSDYSSAYENVQWIPMSFLQFVLLTVSYIFLHWQTQEDYTFTYTCISNIAHWKPQGSLNTNFYHSCQKSITNCEKSKP